MGIARSSLFLFLHSLSAVTFLLLNNHHMEGLSSKAQAIKVFAAGIWGSMFVWHTLHKSCLTFRRDWKAKLRILFVSVDSGSEYLLQIMLVCCLGKTTSPVRWSGAAVDTWQSWVEWVIVSRIASLPVAFLAKKSWLTLPRFYRVHFLDKLHFATGMGIGLSAKTN